MDGVAAMIGLFDQWERDRILSTMQILQADKARLERNAYRSRLLALAVAAYQVGALIAERIQL
jgi:hypothetical protein